jgi:hypothetical protein
MNSLKQVAIHAVKEAGNKLQELSCRKINFTLKNSHDVLAEGDLLSEKIIMDSIQKIYPT